MSICRRILLRSRIDLSADDLQGDEEGNAKEVFVIKTVGAVAFIAVIRLRAMMSSLRTKLRPKAPPLACSTSPCRT